MYHIMLVMLYIVVCVVSAQEFSSADLEFVALVQKEFCGENKLCDSKYAKSLNDSTRLLSDLPLPSPDEIHEDCCQPCSCNITTCHDFGNCCPDILDRLPPLQEALQPRRYTCRKTALKGIHNFYTYWMSGRCSSEFNVQMTNREALEIISKCENFSDYFTLETRQPVVDILTKRTYVNRYCALCDFVQESSIVSFTSSLRCYDGGSLSKNVNVKTLVNDVLSANKCDIEFSWPNNSVNFDPDICRAVTNECNRTGSWAKYDALIETACHTYRSIYNFKYNNIFCFMCNERESISRCADTDSVGSTLRLSFSAVLDFNRQPEEETKAQTQLSLQCTDNQVLDNYKRVCRNTSCTFPGIPIHGECENVLRSVAGAGYLFQLKFTYLDRQKVCTFSDLFMEISIEDYVQTELKSMNVFQYTTDYSFYRMTSFVFVSQILLGLNEDTNGPMANTSIPTISSQTKRPEYAVEVYDYVLCQVRLYLGTDDASSQPSELIGHILDLDQRIVSLYDSVKRPFLSFSLSIVDYELDHDQFPIEPNENRSLIPYFHQMYNQLLEPDMVYRKVKPTLTCPLIEIERNEYNITDLSEGIYIEELNSTFKKVYIEKVYDGISNVKYLICKQIFLEVTNRYSPNHTSKTYLDDDVTTVQGILSVTLSSISVVCSFMTFTTYALFKDLRSQPGINNMYLCIYLICAQLLFTFATPQVGVVSELACSLLGVLTHFFWLMVIFAMNVCCFHMVTVFKGQPENRSNRGSDCLRSSLYVTYCVISSIFFVIVNIIVSLLGNDDSTIGYGKGLCYISQPKMIGFVFAIPLGVVLLFNILASLYVIINISKASNVTSSSRKNRNLLVIYAKLSSLTGLTWILGFLYVFTKVEIIEYFFIILNGGLGFFIFLSFVCNRRTIEKYKSLVCKNDEEKTLSHETQKTKISS